MTLTVSVVIPTYNRAADVVRAVRSVLAQSHPALEILVVDDGSSDDTAARVAELPGPIRYLYKPNGGVSSARNLGFLEARGTCVALLDSDDSWEVEWLSRAIEVLRSDPTCGAVCAEMRLVDTAGKLLSVSNLHAHAQDGALPLPTLFEHHIGLGSNLCTRRTVLDAAGHFDETLVTGEDVDLALRLCAVAGLRIVAEPLIRITKTSGSLSGKINTGNRLRVFQKFESLHPQLATTHSKALRKARSATAYGYALDLTVARQLRAAQARTFESWRYAPSLRAARQLAKIILLRCCRQGR